MMKEQKQSKNMAVPRVDTGRKLNVHKTFRRRPGRPLNVLCTFSLRPVSTGRIFNCKKEITFHVTVILLC